MVESTIDVPVVRRKLLGWYRKNKRRLPWRLAKPDPYLTMVSEAMLQQTQVATVIPYFERFVKRFPTLRSLARADLEEVLSFWSGLGYYRRCHHLHSAAKVIVSKLKGQWPRSAESLMELPGIGRYTAGAVASIAFGEHVAAVDGNARRVLMRICRLETGSTPSHLDQQTWAIAERWVPTPTPGDFNQALMELGATVCRPQQPGCSTCPLRSMCRYARDPAKPRVPLRRIAKVQELSLIALAVRRSGRFWFRRRPDKGLWAGLWEWPSTERSINENRNQAAKRIHSEIGIPVSRAAKWKSPVEFQLTHRRITIEVLCVELTSGVSPRGSGKWLSPDEAVSFALSSAQRTLLLGLPAR